MKLAFKIIIGLFALIALVVLALPTFFSTGLGKGMFERMVGERMKGTLHIDDLSLSWFSSQSARGISFHSDAIDFTCEEFTSSSSLWQIAMNKNWGECDMKGPLLSMKKPFHAVANIPLPQFQRAGFIPQLGVTALKFQIPGSGHLTVERGKIAITSAGLDPIFFNDLDLRVDLEQPNHITFKLIGSTLQNEMKGSIAIQGTESSIQASLTQLPVRGIDQIFSLFQPRYEGLLLSLLGDTLDLNLSATTKEPHAIELLANSSQFHATVSGESVNGIFSLKAPASLSFSLTPSSFQTLGKWIPLHGWSLNAPGTFLVTLDRFSSSGKQEETNFKCSLTAPSELSIAYEGKPFTLSQLHVSADTPSLKNSIDLDATALLSSASLVVSARLTEPLEQTRNGDISLKAVNIPTQFLGPDFTILLGPSLSVDSVAQLLGQETKVQLSVNSPLLQVANAQFRLNQALTLSAPCSFSYALPPLLVDLSSMGMKYEQAEPLRGIIESLELPLDAINQMKLKATVKGEKIHLSGKIPLIIQEINAQIGINTFDQVSLQINGDPLKISLDGSYQGNQLRLTKPLICDLKLDNALLHVFYPSSPTLTKPALVHVVVDPFTSSLQQLNLKGLATIDQLSFTSGTLQKISVPFKWENQGLSAQFSSSVLPSGSLKGDMGLKGAQYTLNCQFQGVQTSLLDAFLTERKLAPLIGNELSGSIKIQHQADRESVLCKVSSPLLTMDMGLLLQPEGVSLQGQKGQVTWTLTPEGYQSIDPNSPFTLKEPSTFQCTLSSLFLPKGETIDVSQMQFVGNGKNPSLIFLDKKSKEELPLSSLVYSINKPKGPFSFLVDCKIGTSGSLSLNSSLFDLSSRTGEVNVKIVNVPSSALDVIARTQGRMDSPFAALFGKSINANFSLDLKDFSGPVQFSLQSPLTQASLNGMISQGTLTLNDAIYVQTRITPEMSRLILKEINPLSLSHFYSDDIVALEIPAQGVSIPLQQSNLQKLTIPKGRFELGKLICPNEGNVNAALGLLKSKQFDKNKDMTLWFAPIDFRINQGLADIERTEILIADTFDIAIWGNFDLVKRYVDMILGLPGPTLARAFGIKNLPDNYVLTIPMKGPADNVKIDTSKATAKMALLFAWQQKIVQGAAGKVPGGALFGEFLSKMATLPDADTPVPPAKHPFPWEVNAKPQKKKTDHSQGKRRHFKSNERPLKQIIKVIR